MSMNANPISGSTWGWIVGLGLGIGLYAVTRPAKASSSANAPPTPPPTPEAPPPLPPPPVAGCQPTPPTLDVWGKANGIRVVVTDASGGMQAVGDQSAAPSVYWKVGEVVLRTQGGAVDELSTKTFCAFAVGDIPLGCSISFDAFGNWAKTKWANFRIIKIENMTNPPALPQLQAMVSPNGLPPPQEDQTLVLTDSMVWRYHQGMPYAAPEVAQAYCEYQTQQGTVSGLGQQSQVPCGEPDCLPDDAVSWHMEGPLVGASHLVGARLGWFYRQVFRYDLGSNAWYILKSVPTFSDVWESDRCAGGGWPQAPDAVDKNPPWRYVVEWYWSKNGWKKYRTSTSWGDAPASWQYAQLVCASTLEGLPTAQPHPADALFPW